jgi:hypothetical protein
MRPEPGFDVVPVVISRYRNHPPLDHAPAEAEAIAGLLAEHLEAAPAWWTAGGERTETSVKEQLNAWADDGARNSMLIWMGHGTSDGLDAWLATSETPAVIRGSGVNPQTFADQLAKQWWRRQPRDGVWAVVVIEACGAGTFVRKVASALYAMPNGPQRLAVIGVGGDNSAGTLGAFTKALRAALASYTDNDGAEIRAEELVSNLRSRIDPGEVVDRGMHKAEPLLRRRVVPAAVSVPMDVYTELRQFLSGLTPDERGHFIPKAQGAEYGEVAWYFVGRHAERQEIAGWLRDTPNGMLVVTGPAGSGKSALLGNVLVHANPTLRDLLVRSGQLEAAEPDEAPPAAFDVVVHLTGVTTGELVGRLAAAAGLEPPQQWIESGGIDWLLDGVRDRGRPFTVLVDALDEAQEPATIAGSVLRRVAALPDARVVVGTRASTREGPDEPAPADEDLIDALGRAPTTRSLVVDRDPAAIAGYVHRRLSAARTHGLLDGTDADLAAVAALIRGDDRGRQFLFARLAVHEILARPHLVHPDRRAELVTLLGGDHRGMFAAAVARLVALTPTFAPLLEALALSRGRGVPRADRIWVIMAGALAEPGVQPTEADIDDLLVAAAPYIMLDVEDDQAVYRLAHRTFQEHFLATPGP